MTKGCGVSQVWQGPGPPDHIVRHDANLICDRAELLRSACRPLWGGVVPGVTCVRCEQSRVSLLIRATRLSQNAGMTKPPPPVDLRTGSFVFLTHHTNNPRPHPGPMLWSMVPKSLLLSLIIRSLSLLLPHTFFQPDEFYQAFEPAHHLVFGYGHLTWEWKDLPGDGGNDWWSTYVAAGRMRGWIWPGVFAAVYKLLAISGLDDAFLLVRDTRSLVAPNADHRRSPRELSESSWQL